MKQILAGVFLCSVLGVSSFGLVFADNQTDTSKLAYDAMKQKLQGLNQTKMQAQSFQKMQDEITQKEKQAYKANYVITDPAKIVQWKSSWIDIAKSNHNAAIQHQNGLAIQKHLQTLQLLKQYEEFKNVTKH